MVGQITYETLHAVCVKYFTPFLQCRMMKYSAVKMFIAVMFNNYDWLYLSSRCRQQRFLIFPYRFFCRNQNCLAPVSFNINGLISDIIYAIHDYMCMGIHCIDDGSCL